MAEPRPSVPVPRCAGFALRVPAFASLHLVPGLVLEWLRFRTLRLELRALVLVLRTVQRVTQGTGRGARGATQRHETPATAPGARATKNGGAGGGVWVPSQGGTGVGAPHRFSNRARTHGPAPELPDPGADH